MHLSNLSVTVLGSAGDTAIPAPLCECRLCEAAKADAAKATTGPGYYVPLARALVDTSEDIRMQLVSENISAVEAVFYSHFHPDHTLGHRWVWSRLDPQGSLKSPPITIYLPEIVVPSFRRHLGLYDALTYAEQGGVARVIEVPRGDSVVIRGVQITPISLAVSDACGFLFEHQEHRILIVPDEAHRWEPPVSLGRLSVAIIPVGICQPHPVTGCCELPTSHPVLARNNTFLEALRQGLALDAETVVFSHIEHHDGVTHQEFAELGEQISHHFGRRFLFASDGGKYGG